MTTTSQTQAVDDARLKQLAAELRCLVCQNQSIADSNAPLAIDLRQQIIEQMSAGRTDADIRQYMAERYGDFVLYKPPMTLGNAALWVGPFVLLAVAVVAARVAIARRNRAGSGTLEAPPPERRASIEARYRQDTSDKAPS